MKNSCGSLPRLQALDKGHGVKIRLAGLQRLSIQLLAHLKKHVLPTTARGLASGWR